MVLWVDRVGGGEYMAGMRMAQESKVFDSYGSYIITNEGISSLLFYPLLSDIRTRPTAIK